MLTSKRIELPILVVIIGLCLGVENVLAQQELRQLELPTINFTRLYNEVPLINLSRLYSRIFNLTKEKPVEEIPLEPEPQPERTQKYIVNQNLRPYPYLQAVQPINGYYANPVLPTFATQQRTPGAKDGKGKSVINVDVPSSVTPNQLGNFVLQNSQSLLQAAYQPGFPYGLGYGAPYGPGYRPGYGSEFGSGHRPGYGSGFGSPYGYRTGGLGGPYGPGGFYSLETVLGDFLRNLNKDLPGVKVQLVTGNEQNNLAAGLSNYFGNPSQLNSFGGFGSQLNPQMGIYQLLQSQALAEAQAYGEEEGLDYAEEEEGDEFVGDDYGYDNEDDFGEGQQLWRKADTDSKSKPKANRSKPVKRMKNIQNKKRQQAQQKHQIKQRSKRISY